MPTDTIVSPDIEELLGHDLACECNKHCDRPVAFLVFMSCCGHRFLSCAKCMKDNDDILAHADGWECTTCGHHGPKAQSPWAARIPI